MIRGSPLFIETLATTAKKAIVCQMTYWGYHLIFTLPIIALLIVLLRHRLRLAHFVCCAIVCLIAFIFTTPWDNYAVYLGIWGFGEGVSLGYPFSNWSLTNNPKNGFSWLGYIPFEEYSFFIIEGVMVCLVMIWQFGKSKSAA
ncbi:lycopene cyclase domain-containing protein [Rubellicoccus peritrichatus]|uniref:Lycopene cyclase domain-containing protein n=1 Tax=Rubellicoccus peritrichatus TaxID=3080537 RepID=A0AAQ3L8K5_9BACT|nr:lycopene cyclase domain-containing protein [Puniceicoccus sp. CR14]WOO39667.1 lycopene cyclase domain-containing protein [Puniceicoccus sp. CR14]